MNESISVVVPVYNEGESIPQLKKQLLPVAEKISKDRKLELIFVDDGSTDGTPGSLRENFGSLENAKIVVHKKNRGVGAAMRTGYENSTGKLIAYLDSDCTYSPGVLAGMLKLLDDKTDIVTVSPYHPQGKVENIPKYRLVLSFGVSLCYRILLWSNIRTFTAMVRVYRRKVLESVKFESDNFISAAEVLCYALLKGFKVKELPTTLRTRALGSSKFKTVNATSNHLKFLLKLLLIRLHLRRLK